MEVVLHMQIQQQNYQLWQSHWMQSLFVFGLNGKRIVSANDFYIGLFETKLKDDEIITNIHYPKIDHNHFYFLKK